MASLTRSKQHNGTQSYHPGKEGKRKGQQIPLSAWLSTRWSSRCGFSTIVLSCQLLGTVATNTDFPGGYFPHCFLNEQEESSSSSWSLVLSTKSVLLVWTPEGFSLLVCLSFPLLPPWPALYGESRHFLKS